MKDGQLMKLIEPMEPTGAGEPAVGKL